MTIGACETPLVTLALSVAAVFIDFGGMNPGKKEDRRNRWIFIPFAMLSPALAILPAYLDGRDLWTTDLAVTPYVGLALLTFEGVLRLVPVDVLGRRFTGIFAIQEGSPPGHRPALPRHPLPQLRGDAAEHAGVRAGISFLARPTAGRATLAVLVARMDAEEALLESKFGEEDALYRRRTWRLVPQIY